MIFSRLLKDTTLLVLKVMTDDIMMEKISIQPPQVQFIVKQDVELLLFFCFCPRLINIADTIINKSLIYGTDLMYGFVKKEDSSGQSHSWGFHIAWFKRNLFYHCRKKTRQKSLQNIQRSKVIKASLRFFFVCGERVWSQLSKVVTTTTRYSSQLSTAADRCKNQHFFRITGKTHI